MLVLHDPVSPRVVCRYLDVADPKLVGQPVESGNIGSPIVSNNLFHCSPPTQNFFEDKRAESATRFRAKCAPFWPCGEGAVSLDDVAKSRGQGHEHGVDVHFAKEGCWSSNSGRYADFSSLLELALVAGVNVPLYILLK